MILAGFKKIKEDATWQDRKVDFMAIAIGKDDDGQRAEFYCLMAKGEGIGNELIHRINTEDNYSQSSTAIQKKNVMWLWSNLEY
ncbi:MAG: hypothetical protein HRT88_18325 [Lentisphaeraceae bacterium]|nr:hypothetical protein [Lentisphaeraceae bacterium]